MELLSRRPTDLKPSGLKAAITALATVALLFSSAALCAAAAQDVKDLPPKWRKWLDEEVVYIISEREREIFLQLETDEQRERFVDGFWEIRDPTPGTERNERKEEHYARFEYANKFYGRDSTREGWRTDRGRIYIILGKPREVNPFVGGGTVYPLELWFYQTDPSTGLPAFFYLIFYKRHGFGEYELYNPVADGPQALVPNAYTVEDAYNSLRNVSPELANASLNLLATEGIGQADRPSLSSLVLLAKIEDQKNRAVDPSYAERILIGTAAITTEYSFNPDKLAYVVLPASDDRGVGMIAYAFQLQPEQIELGQYENKIYGAYEVDLRLADEGGTIIHTETSNLDIEFSEGEFESRKNKPILFEGNLLCPPGRYNVSIQVRNKLTKSYRLISKTVDVPAPVATEAGVGPLILASGIKQLAPAEQTVLRPFQFSDIKISPKPSNTFAPDEALFLLCQLTLPPQRRAESPPEITLAYSFVTAAGEERPVTHSALKKNSFPNTGTQNLMTRVPLGSLQPGKYTIIITVDFGGEGERFSRNAEFTVSPLAPPEPTLFSTDPVVPGSPAVRAALGGMLERMDRIAEAEQQYRSALVSDPGNKDIRIALAELLLNRQRYQQTLDALQPVTASDTQNAQMLRLSARAYFGLERYGQAAKFIERLILSGQTVAADDFNLLAEAYKLDGKPDKAREAWRRSLEIEPDQPEIRKKLEEGGPGAD